MHMKQSVIVFLAAMAVSATSVVAELGDASKLPPAAKKTGLTYDNDIKLILEKSCVKCHSGTRPKSKYSMETLADIIKGGSSDEAAVVPGQSAKSPLVHYVADLVEEYEMPPLDKRDKYPALTQEQVGLIIAWIDQGAK